MAVKCPKCHSENPETKQFCADCGTRLIPFAKDIYAGITETLQTPVKELTTGSTFAGRYQVIEELGKGGMGRVYKVLDTKINEKIALKLIKPEIASDKETIERFSNELKLARKIRHKNVCAMFDIGEAESAHFITMEYVAGEDLKTMIRMSTGLTIGTVLSVGRQICHGLAEAHSLGVVHRDLKPKNIIIDQDGNAKIMDFGIARSMREKGITGGGIIIGTPEYMSPEQTEAKDVDPRSDIYSLGVILYEMATGHVPFEGETALSVAIKHKTEIPSDPKTINPNIPDDLNRLILRCLEKSKEKRYQSAADVEGELERIEKGIPTTQRIAPQQAPLTSREITVKFTMKKLVAPAAGILCLAVFAFLIMRFLPQKHFVPQPLSGKPSLAVLYFENISGDKSLDPWKTALTELLITKLSQSKYINVLSSDRIFSLLKRLNLQEARKYSTEDLVRVADEGGATYTLSGSLMKAGKNIIMTMTLQKPRTGEIISPLNIECGGEEEIFPKVDELAKTIKSDMNLTPDQIATDIDKEIGKITTPSPEAYKFYSEAIKYGNKGDPQKAVELCQKAVAIDPEFAVAYVLMGVSYYNLGLRVKEREFLQKAFDLKDRVSDRERYMIEGEYYGLSEKTYDESIEAFKRLLELYPEDYLGRNDLGWTYFQVEEWDQAIEQLSMIVQGSRTIPTDTYVLLASAYNAKGLYDKTIKLLEDSRTRIGENWLIRLLMGYTYLCQGQYDFALREADKSLALEASHANGHLLKAAVYGRRGDLTKAQKEALEYLDKASGPDKVEAHWALAGIAISQGKYRKAKDDLARAIELANNMGEKGIQSEQHLALAYAYLRSGDREKARREAESALVSASEAESPKWQRHSLFLQGLISIEAGSLDKARKTAAELKDLIDKGMNKKAIRYYDNLLGRLELKQENYPRAIELLNAGLAYVPFPYSPSNDYALFIEPLAAAYHSSGNVVKSIEEYEGLASHAAGSFFYGDIRTRSFYTLGKIAEHQGDKARARENYQKFLDLWKDADPGLPEPEDAKKRLAGLS